MFRIYCFSMQIDCTDSSHLCFINQMRQIMTTILPRTIDKIIFDEMNGYYLNKSNVEVNINNSEEDNKKYLGTYFPRSFSEALTIMNDIYAQKLIRKHIIGKQQINILDIGTGSGGNIVGMMEFFRTAGLNSETINFHTLEGNANAIALQKNIFDSYNQKNATKFKLSCTQIRFTSAATLNSQLVLFLKQKGLAFDFITSFKFLSEFYNIDYFQAKGIYTSFVMTLQNYIAPQGILILFDLVSGNIDRNRPRPFTTQIMSEELNDYTKSNISQLKYILPVCCGKWSDTCNRKMCYIERQFCTQHSRKANDLSKGCYRVMTETRFANQIISSQPSENKYQMSQNSKSPTTCFRTVIQKLLPNMNQVNILNAFTFH